MARASPGDDDRSLRETVTDVLVDHPVRLALLFGSRARGETGEGRDVDVAVVFDGLESSAPGYTDALLSLSADLATELGTDAVDVVDLQRAPEGLVRAAVDDGVVLVGEDREARRLRERLVDNAERRELSPAERFDEVLAAIDDHLA